MVDSDWWVGVALPPLLEVVGLLALSLSDATGGSVTALDVLPAAFYLLALVLIPVFALALYLDARAVARSTETWTPDPRLWGASGIVLPGAGLALLDSPLLLFLASAYLLRRFRSRDAGGDPARDVYSGDDWHEADGRRGDDRRGDEDAVDGATSTDAGGPPERVSRWYYGVALTVATFAVLVVATPLLAGILGVPENAAFVYETVPTVGLFLPLVVVLALVAASVLVPVFSVALFLDVRRIRGSDADWSPDRRVWGAVAVAHLCNLVVPVVWVLTVPAGAYYLWRRGRRLGRPSGLTQ